jgi:hypothetical protein
MSRTIGNRFKLEIRPLWARLMFAGVVVCQNLPVVRRAGLCYKQRTGILLCSGHRSLSDDLDSWS